ncbi:MAG: hypothetical protein ACW99U_10900 [Candidatus Thorarchaeota archaeon]|jgi:NTP pyrophosphatase (non-canonical NTP hydrolase)
MAHGTMTIGDVQERIRRFVQSKNPDWSQLDNRFYLMTHMVEELGELARLMINMELGLGPNRLQLGHTVNEKAVSEIRDALGNILYNVLKTGVSFQIDVEDAFMDRMKRILERYGNDA